MVSGGLALAWTASGFRPGTWHLILLTPMSDDLDVWMSQARDQGDQEAFARVVEDCHHLLRATLLRDTADPDLADELAQDAFARAWQKREQYRSGTSPRAWLLAIARSATRRSASIEVSRG